MELFLMDAIRDCNVMLDLETWGVAPGSAIRSVGAVMFDPHGEGLGEEFYANVDDKSCEAVGLRKELGTVTWWGQQSRAAQDALLVNQQPIAKVADDFHKWFLKQRAVFVWSQGGNFDEPLWQAVCRALGIRAPWKFYDTRCTRTAYDMGSFNPFSIKRAGTYHNALDDAKHQARCVQRAYRSGRKSA